MTTLQKKQKLIEETEKLTEMEKKAIDEAETDIKEGKVITNNEADEQINKWL